MMTASMKSSNTGAYQLLSQEDKERLPLEAYHIDYADDSHNPDKLALVFMQKDAKGMAYVYPITEHLKEVTKDIFLPIIEQIADANRKAQFDRFGYSWARQFTTYIIKGRRRRQEPAKPMATSSFLGQDHWRRNLPGRSETGIICRGAHVGRPPAAVRRPQFADKTCH